MTALTVHLAEERFAAIRSFSQQSAQSDKLSAFVFLISTRAGGVGLNLVAADTVIFYEQDWNPQVDKQALQRAHRIGQVKHVLCINLVTEQTVEEVIKRRAERKLQLSHNIVGEDTDDHQGRLIVGAETGDLRSVVLGLHLLDPALGFEQSDEINLSGLTAMAERVILFRQEPESYMDETKYEINQSDIVVRKDVKMQVDRPHVTYDPGLDEASYISWVEKFKEASRSHDGGMLEIENKSSFSDDRNAKAKEAKKKAEEKKFAKWKALGYSSLSIKDPESTPSGDIMSGSSAVHFVYGDCTLPSKLCPTESVIIFSCVDNSGRWGHGGLFDALAKVSEDIPNAYERASQFDDLHLGDVHLIEISGDSPSSSSTSRNEQWVALAVVQSYNARRKVPRSNISIPDLEQCLSKVAYTAADKSASIHMPRIGNQNTSDRSEWYAVERLLRKYAAIYDINIYVYYFRSSS
ncbi:hypothetical protein Leryth_022465 [Lithospermum erythrorhizon]|nr:hypothetical protein Leryth_022465 [Lithospermum erythrorhizon]